MVIRKVKARAADADRESLYAYKMLHQENGYIWLYTVDEAASDIREESKAEYDAFYAATDEILKNMKFYTPQIWRGSEDGSTVSFDTVDLNGNPIMGASPFEYKARMEKYLGQ